MQDASVAVAWKLAEVGLVLVVLGFIVIVVTTLITALKVDFGKLIGDAVARRETGGAPPAFPFSAIIQGLLTPLADLIKSPVGVGIALLVLSVVLLLGQGALSAGYTDAGAPASPTAAPSSSSPDADSSSSPDPEPTPSPTATPG